MHAQTCMLILYCWCLSLLTLCDHSYFSFVEIIDKDIFSFYGKWSPCSILNFYHSFKFEMITGHRAGWWQILGCLKFFLYLLIDDWKLYTIPVMPNVLSDCHCQVAPLHRVHQRILLEGYIDGCSLIVFCHSVRMFK